MSRWGEQVPTEVWERLKADKVSDGILNERKFALKKPGELAPQVVMPGESGQPLARDAQITRW